MIFSVIRYLKIVGSFEFRIARNLHIIHILNYTHYDSHIAVVGSNY